uniref:Uncharacterized protein n=1 Tax=Glossina brevipalpis TaxID=37001 RepID=A0A1A9WH42_9MUSC
MNIRRDRYKKRRNEKEAEEENCQSIETYRFQRVDVVLLLENLIHCKKKYEFIHRNKLKKRIINTRIVVDSAAGADAVVAAVVVAVAAAAAAAAAAVDFLTI